jgi:hypothetical protein
MPLRSPATRLLSDALVMGGTGTPVPPPAYVKAMVDQFVVPLMGAGYTGVGLTTPERLTGINQSVLDGVSDLETAMAAQPTGQPFVVVGYSQSTTVQNVEKVRLEQQKAAGQPVPDVTLIEIGNGNRPNGGIAERLTGYTIPLFDFTFNGAAPTDTQYGIPTIDIARQYDGLTDTPEFLINPVADLNALLGVIFVHAAYVGYSLDPASPGYVPGTTVQQYGDTTYYFIPNAQLPLLDPLRLLGVPEKVLDIVQPVLSVLVEAGYDRSIPFGQPTPAQLIPVIDPVTFGLQLAAATLEGANNAAALVGAQLPGYESLMKRLSDAQTWSANTIGKPYGAAVSAINRAFNPIVAFGAVEGRIATAFDAALGLAARPGATKLPVSAATTPDAQPTAARQALPSAARSVRTARAASPGLATTPSTAAHAKQRSSTDGARSGRGSTHHRD